jgi:hypothetical protein
MLHDLHYVIARYGAFGILMVLINVALVFSSLTVIVWVIVSSYREKHRPPRKIDEVGMNRYGRLSIRR